MLVSATRRADGIIQVSLRSHSCILGPSRCLDSRLCVLLARYRTPTVVVQTIIKACAAQLSPSPTAQSGRLRSGNGIGRGPLWKSNSEPLENCPHCWKTVENQWGTDGRLSTLLENRGKPLHKKNRNCGNEWFPTVFNTIVCFRRFPPGHPLTHAPPPSPSSGSPLPFLPLPSFAAKQNKLMFV